MHPFSESHLEDLWTASGARNERLADILLIAGWTGLRWSELRAVRVRDFVEIPMPLLVVQRAAPEGIEVKVTKGGRARRVPLADRVLPLVRELAHERDGDDLLFVTDSGHRLHASAFKRTVVWSTISGGRRIHDLRHRRRVSGWPEVWTRRRCRPGWGTPRSPRPTSTCITRGRVPTGPVWTV